MKLLVITPFPPLKGPEADHALLLCEHLAQNGVDVRVLTTKGSVASAHPNVKVYPIMRRWSWRDLPRLALAMRFCSPDRVLLMYLDWGYNYHPMITFAPTIAKSMLPGVPFVTLFEDYLGAHLWESRLMRAMRKLLEWWAGRKRINTIRDTYLGPLVHDSDRYIMVSERIRALLAEACPSMNGNCALIPPPPLIHIQPDDDGMVRRRKREELGVKPDDVLLAFFGYIYPSKGIETLLKSLRMVCDRRGDVRLVVIGGTTAESSGIDCSYPQKMRDLAKQLDLEAHVVWTGGYEWDSELPSACLRAADICVLPFDTGVSVHNTSFAAAAAHGLPTITTRGPVLDGPFVHAENTFLCSPEAPEELAEAIESVIRSPALRDRLRRGALQLASDLFSWETATKRTIAALS